MNVRNRLDNAYAACDNGGRKAPRDAVNARGLADYVGVDVSSMPPEERFFTKVREDSQTGCWEWTGAKVRGGYGKFFTHKVQDGARRRTILVPAHRWSYEFMVGPIPVGLEIDHLCRNKSCVNPGHLEPVTHRENTRRVPRRPNCPRGHEFTPENSMKRAPREGRACRACALIAAAARRARRRMERDA